MSLEFVIIRGYGEDAASVLDQGVKRSAADLCHIAGHPATDRLTGIIRSMLFAYGSGSYSSASAEKIRDLTIEHEEAGRFAMQRFGCNHTTPIAIRGVVARAWYTQNHQRLEDFMKVLQTGLPVRGVEDNAALLLKARYDKDKINRNAQSRLKMLDHFQLGQTSLLAFLKEESRLMLKPTRGSSFPVKSLDAMYKKFLK